jgi:hypothetical protein
LGCYLCAYQTTYQPKNPMPLPTGSPASPTDPLGTCGQCSVWACSGHATRYAMFLCAMCRPAVAITGAVNPTGQRGAGAAATRAAMDVGLQVGAGDDRQDRVRQALTRVSQDAAQGRGRRVDLLPRPDNLVWDLAGATQDRFDGTRHIPAVRDPARARLLADLDQPVEISLDGIAGAVRGLFGDTPFLGEATDEQVTIVTGALVMAMAVADDPDQSGFDGSINMAPGSVEIKPPWEVSHPILLSPEAWLIASAYGLS